MKLSCLPVSFFSDIMNGKMTIEAFAEKAAKLGLDAIDLSILLVGGKNPKELADIRKNVEALGLKINMITTYTDFTHPEADEQKRQDIMLKSHIDTARQLGAAMVRVTAGQAHPGVDRKAGISRAVDGFARNLPYACENGIELVYENHGKPGVWEYFDFSYPTGIFLDIAGAMGQYNMGINFDTANTVAYGDNPMEALEKTIKRIVCIHASDTEAYGVFKPVVIGTGAAPFKDIFNRLKRAAYDGWISIEEASCTGFNGLDRAVAFIRKTWNSSIKEV